MPNLCVILQIKHALPKRPLSSVVASDFLMRGKTLVRNTDYIKAKNVPALNASTYNVPALNASTLLYMYDVGTLYTSTICTYNMMSMCVCLSFSMLLVLELGDHVLLGPQTVSKVISIPESSTVLVQLANVPGMCQPRKRDLL